MMRLTIRQAANPHTGTGRQADVLTVNKTPVPPTPHPDSCLHGVPLLTLALKNELH